MARPRGNRDFLAGAGGRENSLGFVPLAQGGYRTRVINLTNPAASEINNIRAFSSTGRSGPGVLGFAPLAHVGYFDPTTGMVYPHPRVQLDPLAADANVVVTNPEATGPQVRERTASLGMGGIGQVGRFMDVGAPSE